MSEQCPNCGYPDTFDGKHYKGLYTPGRLCPHCGDDERVKPQPGSLYDQWLRCAPGKRPEGVKVPPSDFAGTRSEHER